MRADSVQAGAQLALDVGQARAWPPRVHAALVRGEPLVVQGEPLAAQGEPLAAPWGVSAGSHEAVAQRTH